MDSLAFHDLNIGILSILRNSQPLFFEILQLPIFWVLSFWNTDETMCYTFSLCIARSWSLVFLISVSLRTSSGITSSAMSSKPLILSSTVSNLVLNVLVEFLTQTIAFSISRKSIFSYLLSDFFIILLIIHFNTCFISINTLNMLIFCVFSNTVNTWRPLEPDPTIYRSR